MSGEAHSIVAYLNDQTVKKLVAAMRIMKGGTLEYDYSKRSKVDLLTHAAQLSGAYKGSLEDLKGELLGKGETVSVTSGHVDASVPFSPGDTLTITKGDSKKGSPIDFGAPGNTDHDEGDYPEEFEHEPTGQREGVVRERPKSRGQQKSDGEEEGKDEAEGESKEEARARLAQQLKDMIEGEQRRISREELEKLIQAEMEKRSNVYRVEVSKGDGEPVCTDSERPRHKVFKEVVQAVNRGVNVLLVGPAGSGKTFMAEQVATTLQKSFRYTGAVSSEYKLLGFVTAQGTTVRTEYREAYEHGGVFLWDELDASSAQALMSFNAGLGNNHQDFPDAIVRKHPDFRAIASANTYGNGADRLYVGRNQLDAASLDRFYLITMDYDEELEKSLYGSSSWVNYVQSARRACRQLNLRHVVSMRAIEHGIKMQGSGVPRGDIERAVLWKHLPGEDVRKVKEQMRLQMAAE